MVTLILKQTQKLHVTKASYLNFWMLRLCLTINVTVKPHWCRRLKGDILWKDFLSNYWSWSGLSNILRRHLIIISLRGIVVVARGCELGDPTMQFGQQPSPNGLLTGADQFILSIDTLFVNGQAPSTCLWGMVLILFYSLINSSTSQHSMLGKLKESPVCDSRPNQMKIKS